MTALEIILLAYIGSSWLIMFLLTVFDIQISTKQMIWIMTLITPPLLPVLLYKWWKGEL